MITIVAVKEQQRKKSVTTTRIQYGDEDDNLKK